MLKNIIDLDKNMPSLLAKAEKKKVSISIGNAREAWRIVKEYIGWAYSQNSDGEAALGTLCQQAYDRAVQKGTFVPPGEKPKAKKAK